LMMELFAQTHSICLIYQAQRGFLLFLTVNLGVSETGGWCAHARIEKKTCADTVSSVLYSI
jgi:hypothetical protein